jgi:hypothetical protein
LLNAAGAALLLLCSFAGAPAAAADADLKITVTNGNDTSGDVKVQVRPAGQHGVAGGAAIVHRNAIVPRRGGRPHRQYRYARIQHETVGGARSGGQAWLVAHSVAGDRVTSRGYGDTRPLVANDTDANRFKNRRVELRRMNCR